MLKINRYTEMSVCFYTSEVCFVPIDQQIKLVVNKDPFSVKGNKVGLSNIWNKIGAWKCNFQPFSEIWQRTIQRTNQPTDQQTDGYRRRRSKHSRTYVYVLSVSVLYTTNPTPVLRTTLFVSCATWPRTLSLSTTSGTTWARRRASGATCPTCTSTWWTLSPSKSR